MNLLAGALAQSRGLARRGIGAGLLHLSFSMLIVQGLSYAAQLVIARLVGPLDFGIVRTVEAVLGVALIFGAAGMPTLAVKAIAQQTDASIRTATLRTLLRIALVTGAGSAIVMAIMSPLFVDPRSRGYLIALAATVPVTAFSRTALGYFQGIKQVHRLSALNAALSLVSLTAIIVAVVGGGLKGWVVGRYIGEALFAVGVMIFARDVIFSDVAAPRANDTRQYLALGFPIALSLGMRSAIDAAGIWAVSLRSPLPEAGGLYGLATLVVAVALVVPGALANLTIPLFAERRRLPGAVAAALRSYALWAAAAASLAVAAAMLALPMIISATLTEYVPAVGIIQVLLLSVPFRTVAALSGAVLIAHDRSSVAFYTNTALLAASITAYWTLIPAFGPVGAAWISVGVEAVGACVLYITARRATVGALA